MRGRPPGPCNAAEIEQRRAAARQSRPNRKPTRWTVERLELLRNDYEGGFHTVDAIAAFYFTSRGRLMVLAKQNGWRRRLAPAVIAHMTASRPAPYVRGVYRRNASRPWRDVEIVGPHRDGGLILHEIGKLWPGVWRASLDQVRIAGRVFEFREPFGLPRKAA